MSGPLLIGRSCLACCVSVPEHGTAHLFTDVTTAVITNSIRLQLDLTPRIPYIYPSYSWSRRRLRGNFQPRLRSLRQRKARIYRYRKPVDFTYCSTIYILDQPSLPLRAVAVEVAYAELLDRLGWTFL